MEVTIKHLSTIKNLCRICLTKNKKMTSLYNEIEIKLSSSISSLTNLLNQVFHTKILDDEQYPSYICSICINLLKMAYELKLRFEESQKLLDEYFGEKNLESTAEAIQEESRELAPVELISKIGKFDLKDVFIVETEQEEIPNFTGFLKNLGKEISANFVVHNNAMKQHTDKQNNRVSITLKNSSKPYIEVETDNLNKAVEIVQKATLNDIHDSGKDVKKKNKKMKHMERKYLHKKQSFICEVCGIFLKSKSSRYHHMMKHCGKQHQCTYCCKTYFTSSTLLQHINAVHKNTRLHLCTMCGKTFNYANALDYHMRIHTNEKKYKCSYCAKTFRMQCGLSRHLRIHTGVRPYKCKFCDKAFRSKGELDCHEMIHTGYRPYHCKYCGKGFTKTYNLKIHLVGHTGEHICRICDKSFVEVEYLKNHIKNAHLLLQEEDDNSQNS